MHQECLGACGLMIEHAGKLFGCKTRPVAIAGTEETIGIQNEGVAGTEIDNCLLKLWGSSQTERRRGGAYEAM